jgi:hypothetical protein
MGETQEVENINNAQQPEKKKKFISSVLAAVRELLAILFWVYVITKVFIYDIDVFLVEKFFPSYKWLLEYKFFILIGILALLWLVTKNKHILLWSLFVFFYPFILIFWRIPVFVFKQKSWTLALAIIDSVISFFRSFRFTFITTSLFLVSVVIIYGSTNKPLLWFSLTVLFVILSLVYLQKIKLIFKPSAVYQLYTKLFFDIGAFLRTNPALSIDDMVELPLESMDEKQIQKWSSSLQQLVLFNRLCLFVAKKMKLYQENSFKVLSSVIGILVLVIFTVFSFAFINYGLFKINQQYYLFSNIPTFFHFFYYSFNNLLFNQIKELTAATPATQVISMLESFLALFLISIFASLLLPFRSQRDLDELNRVIKNLTEEGARIEGYIKEKYKVSSVEDAIEALQKLQIAVLDLIYMITKTI